jgi:hypothetical protein
MNVKFVSVVKRRVCVVVKDFKHGGGANFWAVPERNELADVWSLEVIHGMRALRSARLVYNSYNFCTLISRSIKGHEFKFSKVGFVKILTWCWGTVSLCVSARHKSGRNCCSPDTWWGSCDKLEKTKNQAQDLLKLPSKSPGSIAWEKPQKLSCRTSSRSPSSHRDGPGSRAGQVMWDLWWTERYWSRFSPSTSVSLATHSFH